MCVARKKAKMKTKMKTKKKEWRTTKMKMKTVVAVDVQGGGIEWGGRRGKRRREM